MRTGPAPGGPSAEQGDALIVVDNLRKSFFVNGRELPIFSGLSTRFTRGSFTSIVGPSGCGKSTLLRLIAGLDRPMGGEILFANSRIDGPPKGMICVFQQYSKSVLPWRTVIENMEFGLLAQRNVPKTERLDRCHHHLAQVGLRGYERHYPAQLSGGMQQRLAIARALVCEPAVLLMDEPFSAVDAMTRAILQELILKIWQDIQITIVLVTHDVEEALFLSTDVLALRRAPDGIRERIPVPLAYPRDQITTREDATFLALRQQLFSHLFAEEKSAALPATL